jgi:hypothetical protein
MVATYISGVNDLRVKIEGLERSMGVHDIRARIEKLEKKN